MWNCAVIIKGKYEGQYSFFDWKQYLVFNPYTSEVFGAVKNYTGDGKMFVSGLYSLLP